MCCWWWWSVCTGWPANNQCHCWATHLHLSLLCRGQLECCRFRRENTVKKNQRQQKKRRADRIASTCSRAPHSVQVTTATMDRRAEAAPAALLAYVCVCECGCIYRPLGQLLLACHSFIHSFCLDQNEHRRQE